MKMYAIVSLLFCLSSLVAYAISPDEEPKAAEVSRDEEVQRLADELVVASPAERVEILDELSARIIRIDREFQVIPTSGGEPH